MKKSRLLGAVCACLMVVTINASAAVVNADWKSTGDNKLTYDLGTGLYWLDLTESNGLSRDYVLTQLDSGGNFEGFRYATSSEVVDLWSNFSIDLSEAALTESTGHNPDIITATIYIGNILPEYDSVRYPYGAQGITSEAYPDSVTAYQAMGAWHDNSTGNTLYATDGGPQFEDMYGSDIHIGHYLVATAVPLPAAAWLFGSGLLGLVGVARRKALQ